MTRFLATKSLVVPALLVAGVRALARTNATCVSEFWSFNTYQQSPCLVAAYLSTPCSTTGDWDILALERAGDYYGLTARIASPCQCNTVLWNLLSACSMCQTGYAGSWATWTTNCTAVGVNVGKYPLPIPAGTAVPHWAYYDFTGTGVFNTAVASQQSGPESTAGATPTSSPASSLIGSATTSATSNLLQPTITPQSQSKSTNNTGAIVGGTVGGVLGLVAIGIIIFMVVRKGQRKPEPASHGGYDPSVGTHPGSTAPMTAQHQLQPGSPGIVSAPSMGSGSAYKPYDPSDPSTFPPGSNMSGPPTSYTESLPYSGSPQHQARQGNYTGAPQV